MANEKMGWVGAAAIGVGGMVGGGIFAVLGTAVSMAHGATPIAFVVAGVIAVLTAESYARLSAAYPSSGGTVVFVHQAFGHHLTTGATNLFLWVNYLVTIALYAAAFGLSAAIAGLAGLFVGSIRFMTPSMGADPLMKTTISSFAMIPNSISSSRKRRAIPPCHCPRLQSAPCSSRQPSISTRRCRRHATGC